ncbi:MAG: hypothetical protein EAY75_17470 [Bacteroidetes bacterium]|nr:MAG: hypothetical protein EAY75_17470 [Bacteroidota bacterium]
MKSAYIQSFLLSFTIVIPAIIGLVRYRQMDRRYHPFVWICCFTVCSELFKFYLNLQNITSTASYNIALMVVSCLYLYLFWGWGLLRRPRGFVYGFAAILLVVWVADHFLIGGIRIHARTNLFRVCFALTIVTMSIENLSRLVTLEKQNLARNAQFLICLSLTLYYTFRILIDVFMPLGSFSRSFQFNLATTQRIFLQLLYFTFALATLWIPTKKKFTMLF